MVQHGSRCSVLSGRLSLIWSPYSDPLLPVETVLLYVIGCITAGAGTLQMLLGIRGVVSRF